MKKLITVMIILMLMLALTAPAFAMGQSLTMEEAKQTALDRAGVKAADALFTKVYKDYDDGRLVYEVEFYVDNTEYDMDIDAATGMITDFNMECHGGYNSRSAVGGFVGGYHDMDDIFDFDDDFYDWD